MQLTFGIDSAIASARLWALMLRIRGIAFPLLALPVFPSTLPDARKAIWFSSCRMTCRVLYYLSR